MNRVNIETSGPVMENLCRVEVSDDHDSETIHLDNTEIEEAVADGTIVEFVAQHLSNGRAILRDAIANGSPVYVDGSPAKQSDLDAAFGHNAEGDMTARP